MNFQLNGQSHQTVAGTTIGSLLAELQLQPERVVLELNQVILNANEYREQQLKEGDKLEIIQFVGGG
ncbi:MAG: sulfur carrier protein ThiS [Geopsychrobacter sp.]|nr:sulfur carrier protein ThiS [Geopsychrobacter sp.]